MLSLDATGFQNRIEFWRGYYRRAGIIPWYNLDTLAGSSDAAGSVATGSASIRRPLRL
jgi:hypothetical protein